MFTQRVRELTENELVAVSGGYSGSEALPNVIYSSYLGYDEKGNDLWDNKIYNSQGQLISETTSNVNEYQRDLDLKREIESAIPTQEPNIPYNPPALDFGYSDYNYGGNYSYFDGPRDFSGRPINYGGVIVDGGEISYA